MRRPDFAPMAHPHIDPPFGTFALPGPLERLRRASETMESERATRNVRRFLALLRKSPVDAVLFGDQKMRLHLHDNRTEKRIVCGEQFYDPEERAEIARIATSDTTPFVMVDAGANVGAYTFIARSILAKAKREATIIAFEPDPENAARLRANIAANDATDVRHIPVALSNEEGTVRFRSVQPRDRGRAQVADDGDLEVPSRPLATVLAEQDVTHVDVLKMDIEGYEAVVLGVFFQQAPATLHPRLVILETYHDGDDALPTLLAEHGYAAVAQSRANTVYERRDVAP
ncbi:FkbM family methyltransferase [Jannaschia sp.]|nr:FkbM family methyltransferase [Jannaschia sp.]